MNSEREGIYAPSLIDWFTFRRRFVLPTDANPETIEKRLAAVSQPPPADPTPFTASISVAVAHTIAHTGLFEIHLMRGLPWGDHYSSLIVVGHVTEPERQEVQKQAYITGEIAPAQRGMTIYTGTIMLFMLWVAAASISAVVSPMSTLVPMLVATFTTLIAIAVIYGLLITDLRRLTAVLHEVQ